MTQADIQAAFDTQGLTKTRVGALASEATAEAARVAAAAATNADNFTGAFPAGVLANTPRTGFTLADTSRNLGPEAGSDAADILATAFRDGSARLCARVLFSGADIRQADVSSVTYSIYLLDDANPNTRTVVTGHDAVSLAKADMIFDTIQTDAQASGYNFRHQIDVSAKAAFATVGNYLVEYRITPTAGQVVLVRFKVRVI